MDKIENEQNIANRSCPKTPHYAISESEKLEAKTPNQEDTIVTISDSFLEAAFDTHMSEFDEGGKSSSKSIIPNSEQKTKNNFTDLVAKTKMDLSPSPMKSQRLMQRRKQVSFLCNNKIPISFSV